MTECGVVSENNNENNVELDNIINEDDEHMVEDQAETFHIDNEDIRIHGLENTYLFFSLAS